MAWWECIRCVLTKVGTFIINTGKIIGHSFAVARVDTISTHKPLPKLDSPVLEGSVSASSSFILVSVVVIAAAGYGMYRYSNRSTRDLTPIS